MSAIAGLKAFRSCQRGATAIEYGLIVALLAMVLVTVMTQLGGGSNGLFQGVVTALGS